MKPDQMQMRFSSVGITLLVVSLAAGLAVSAAIGNPAPLVAGALVGLYFLFAIRVADQWEKVAVLRFGKFTGLRGPGLFHVLPIVDRLSRYVDQRVRVANVSAESTLTATPSPSTSTPSSSGWCGTRRKRFWRYRTMCRQPRSARRRRYANRSAGTCWHRW